MKSYKLLTLLSGCQFLLTACGGNQNSAADPSTADAQSGINTMFTVQDGPPADPYRINVADISDAIPQKEPLSRYGNPSSYEVFGKRYYPLRSSKNYKERGIASWYGSKFHGKRTSSGEAYNMHAMTAAHKTLPLPTYVKVTNLRNNRQVILKVNDRGPFHENRIIDLSHTAAIKLGIIGQGTGLVEVEAIDPDRWDQQSSTAPPSPSEQSSKSINPVELYVQVGAFVNIQNARKLRSNMQQQLQQQVNITTAESKGQKFYRVRIGPLASAEQADTLSSQIHQQGFGTPRILIE